jgi:hypothetical protein
VFDRAAAPAEAGSAAAVVSGTASYWLTTATFGCGCGLSDGTGFGIVRTGDEFPNTIG